MRIALCMVSLLLSQAAVARAPLPRPLEIATDILGGEDSGDQVLLYGSNPTLRYSLPSSEVSDDSAALRAIQTAIRETRLLTLTVDWGAAHLDTDRTTMIFPICAIRFHEISATMSAPCPRSDTKMLPGYAALAEAMASAEATLTAESLSLFKQAIESGDLEKDWRLNALHRRGDAEVSLAFTFPDWSLDQDRLLIAALADFRTVESARPSPEVKTEIANALSRLRAYDEARAAIAASVDPEDPERFQQAITTASIARLQGKPQEALDILNELRARLSTEPGMKFHYHRGRTLMKLGRMDEAVADFTAGIGLQPDYSSAFVLRGCAYAALGEVTRAKDAFETANAKILTVAVDPSESGARKQVIQMIARMEIAEQSGNRVPDATVCDDYIDKLDSKRSRSPLLP